MKKGKWNYTEDITYRVVLVELKAVNMETHWQNSRIGSICQAVEITCKDGTKFLIDNTDGSGLQKVNKGGGPDSYHASIKECSVIGVVDEIEWKQFDLVKHNLLRKCHDEWLENNYPDEYEKLQGLRKYLKSLKK